MDGGFPYGRTSGIDTGSSPGIKKAGPMGPLIYLSGLFLFIHKERRRSGSVRLVVCIAQLFRLV